MSGLCESLGASVRAFSIYDVSFVPCILDICDDLDICDELDIDLSFPAEENHSNDKTQAHLLRVLPRRHKRHSSRESNA
jgi:hypothetical protein